MCKHKNKHKVKHNIKHKMITEKIILIIVLFALIVLSMPVKAQEFEITDEELGYINKKNVIKAVSMHGGAPLQYADANGNVKGISKEVLETISNMTGLKFSYQLYETLDEAFNSGADIFFGIPYNYAPEGMVMSVPFLKSETILFINSSVNPSMLDDKKYAAVRGSDLPEGIQEENAVFFETREASIDAVERGLADYGYGNAFSVAFYIIQNNYRNILQFLIKKNQENIA